MSHEIARRIAKVGGQGIISPSDLPVLDSQRGQVALLMLDGEWHTAFEVLNAAGGSEGLRRLRELREIKGVEIERRRRATNRRVFEYRLVVDTGQPKQPKQGSLL